MKKIILMIVLMFLFVGCTTNKRLRKLEFRVTMLEMAVETHEEVMSMSSDVTPEDKKHLFRMMKRANKAKTKELE